MARYGQVFKDRAVARLLPPESAPVQQIAQELTISAATLERWMAAALAKPAQNRVWTAQARLEALIATASMDEAGKSAWCRENGLYPQELTRWRDAAAQALADLRPGHQDGALRRAGLSAAPGHLVCWPARTLAAWQ